MTASVEVISEILCVLYMVIFITSIVVLFIRNSKTGSFRWETLDWHHVVQDLRGLGQLRFATLRLFMACFALVTTAMMVSRGPIHAPGSRVAVQGLDVLGTFTIWCWSLIGIYFAIAGSATAFASRGPGSRALARFLWVFFQVMFSSAILVFLVVWLVLIPSAYAATGTSAGLLTFLPFCAHNLNVIFMSIEMYVNRLSFVRVHALFIMMYGAAYIVFSWLFYWFTGIFFYFFIDWRSPFTVIWYTALIAVLYAAFSGGQKLVLYVKEPSMSQLPGISTREAVSEAPARPFSIV